MTQQFGGTWTESKMRIVVEYAKAYLTIMAKQKWIKTVYFDGFAGSGIIEDSNGEEQRKGTAIRVLDIIEPRPFDLYYFVELNEAYRRSLKSQIATNYPGRNAHVIRDNCNSKLRDLGGFLKLNKSYRALAFVDPYGMDVAWSSIEYLKGLGVDLWILVPTGVGPNRLLKLDGEISDSWYKALEAFLGLGRIEINNRFYSRTTTQTLFGEETKILKERQAIQKLGELYAERLGEIFKYVSNPFVMKNGNNAIMYHFMMATNNAVGVKIANDVIKPKFSQ